MHLPKGQHLVKDFITITVESNSNNKPNDLTIVGFNSITYGDLLSLIDIKKELDMHCVEGWSVVHRVYEGVSINRIIDLVQPQDFRYLLLQSKGGFKSFVFKEDLGDSFICLKIDEKPLTIERGFPMRFVAPNIYAYKWVKHLNLISFEVNQPIGYWENRGYSARARIACQERFSK